MTLTIKQKAQVAGLLVALMVSPCSFGDMKGKLEMHYSYTIAPPGVQKESTLVEVFYVQGSARRKDQGGKVGTRSAVIRDCDSGKGYSVDLVRKEYWELRPLRESNYDYLRDLYHGTSPSLSAKMPRVIVRSLTVESGEPRVLFGRAAHHFVTTAKEFLGDSEQVLHAEETIEGWYWPGVRPFSEACMPADLAAQPFAWIGEPDPITDAVPVFRHTGPSPIGFPVEETRTLRTKPARGGSEWTTLTVVGRLIEFSNSPLDPSLFQIPSGFARVPRPQFYKLNERK